MKCKQTKEIDQSIKFYGTGFLVGAAVAIEENKKPDDILKFGIAGTLASMFFEIAFPKTASFIKSIL